MAWDGLGEAVSSARTRPSATRAALDDENISSFFRIVSLEVLVVSVLDALRLGDDPSGLIPTGVEFCLSGHNAGRWCLFSQRGWPATIVGRHLGFGRSMKADTGTMKAARATTNASPGT